MFSIGNFKHFNMLMLIMVSLNLCSFVCAFNQSSINNYRKIILGTHWNRIGKRLEFKHESSESQAQLVNKIKSCRDLLVFTYLVERYQIWLKEVQFNGIF